MRLNILPTPKRTKRAAARKESPRDRIELVRQSEPHLKVASAEGPNSPFTDPQGEKLSEAEALAEVEQLTRRSLSRLGGP